jgi:hypothetical protein
VSVVFLAALAAAQSSPEEIVPLKTGSTWTYVAQGKEAVYKITGREKVGDTDCAVLEVEIGGRTLQKEYLALDQDGLRSLKVVLGERTLVATPPVCRLKLPLKKGDAWEWKGKQGDRAAVFSYTNEGEEEIETPGGKHKAWKIVCAVEDAGNEGTMTYWYAPGVGMVRQDSNITVQGKTMKVSLELKEHSIPK